MRDIKFRAIPNKDFMINENQKNTLNSIAYYTKGEFYDDTFIYGYLGDGYIIGKTIETGEEYFVPSYWIPVEKETIGQYTGLKDKNGKEIYEGDIIQYTFDSPESLYATENGLKVRISKVFWSEWRGSFAVGDSLANNDLFNYVRNGNRVEVIGNIYENKELLEVK